MEEKEKIEKPQKPPKKRKVSLFKRRKKPEIRPFVREKKEKKIQKLLKTLLVLILAIFAICLMLYGARAVLAVILGARDSQIISPQSASRLNREPIDEILKKNDVVFSDLNISTISGAITFKTDNAKVYFDQENNLSDQVIMLKEILKQLSLSGKRATLVDLRYNKPIVKF